jgi:hypothetical protein
MKALSLAVVVVIAAVACMWGVGMTLALRIVGGYVLGVVTGVAIKTFKANPTP